MNFLLEHWNDIATGVAVLYAGGRLIAKWTPSRKDDEFFDRIEQPLKELLEHAPKLIALVADKREPVSSEEE